MGKDKTDAKKKQVLTALKACGGKVRPACRSVGVSPRTYYNWLKTDQSFAKSVKGEAASDEAAAFTDSLKRIVSLLREQGKYSGELAIQAELAARLIRRFDDIDQRMHCPDYDMVNIELSREGHSRASVNPLEKLYLEYYDRIHRALRALGMNVDAKERKTDNDTFTEFMQEFKKDD